MIDGILWLEFSLSYCRKTKRLTYGRAFCLGSVDRT